MKRVLFMVVALVFFFSSAALAEPEVYSVGGEKMAASCTSTWVINIGKLKDIDGYFTFGIDSIAGCTSTAIAGTTINAYWRVSQHNTANHWDKATQNTIFSGIDVNTGNKNIGYDLTTSGVTPLQYMRIEIVSGITDITPVGTLLVR